MTPRTLLAALAVVAVAAPVPVHADLWGHLPPVAPPSLDDQVEIESSHPPDCAPDDPVCQISCGPLLSWDTGLDVAVDLPNRRIVIPGPGLGSGSGIGHWTVCL